MQKQTQKNPIQEKREEEERMRDEEGERRDFREGDKYSGDRRRRDEGFQSGRRDFREEGI